MVSSSLATLLAGCSITEQSRESEPSRELQLLLPSVSESSSGWSLSIDIYNSDNTFAETYFHNVRLVAYSKTGSLVCEKSVGDVLNQVNVELVCSGFPYFITVDARESPCDEKNELMLLEHDGKDDEGEHFWKTRYRECGEELPPQSN